MTKKVLSRLKNKKVALAVSSGILLILVNHSIIGLELSTTIESTVNTVLTILVALGIVSNPDSHIKDE